MEKPDYVQELVAILARLRAPDGCPWDREQTHDTLKRYLIEEAGEFLEALEAHNDASMADELGDVLLQIVFHCQIASEEGRFNLQDAARLCCEKMIRRHPHVFADTKAADADAVLRQWDTIKAKEKSDSGHPAAVSALDGVPRHLPALHRAHKVQKKAAAVGFDWPDLVGVVAKVEEELGEVRAALAENDDAKIRDEIGDLLFSVVNLSRFRGYLAEDLLDDAIAKFRRRFQALETRLVQAGRQPQDCTLAELEAQWQTSKAEEDK
jgi:tetrapyrrole methylase family protein/MazG family protein